MTDIIAAGVSGVTAILCAVIVANQKRDEKQRRDAHERMELVIECLDAALDGLHQQKCNGKVTTALERLDKYKNAKAAG